MANGLNIDDEIKFEANPFSTNISRAALMDSLNKIDNASIRGRFKSTDDPINLAFEAIENVPLKSLAKDFVKESFMDIVSFITDICK